MKTTVVKNSMVASYATVVELGEDDELYFPSWSVEDLRQYDTGTAVVSTGGPSPHGREVPPTLYEEPVPVLEVETAGDLHEYLRDNQEGLPRVAFANFPRSGSPNFDVTVDDIPWDDLTKDAIPEENFR